MANIVRGDRVGKRGRFGVGCSACVFDQPREKMLLVRRMDNNLWAVPGGYMEPGESFTEACKREVLEETGLEISINGLIGVYTSPHLLLEYPDGNKWQLVILHFHAEVFGGQLSKSDEIAGSAFFSLDETVELEMSELDRLRIMDGFDQSAAAAIREDFSL